MMMTNQTTMTNQLFAAALGITSPWFVHAINFDAAQRQLTVRVDFAPGTRFAHSRSIQGGEARLMRFFS